MTTKQIPGSIYAPDGSLYITLTDGAGNLVQTDTTASLVFGVLPSSTNNVPVTNGTGYAAGDTILVSGGTSTRAAKIGVIATQVISATVVSGGSGGSNGPVTITGTTGNNNGGTLFQATGTISGGALTGPLVITVSGTYFASPTSLSVEPVAGGGLTGATVSLVMSLESWTVCDCGRYTAIPTNPVSQASTTGSGTGATFTLNWGPIAATVDAAGLGGAGNDGRFALGGGDPTTFAAQINCGPENTYLGESAGLWSNTGGFNTGIGAGANGGLLGAVPLRGQANTAVGCDCMRNVGPTAGACTAVGQAALRSVTGSWNTGIGQQAGFNTTSGYANVFIGYNSGISNTTGVENVVIGESVGSTTLNGNNNILIGTTSSTDLTAGVNNTIIIGATSGTIPWVTGSLVSGSLTAVFGGTVSVPGGTNPVLTTTSAVTSGAGSSTGTLTNAPAAGNPSVWIPFNNHGTTVYIPAWT